MQPQKTHLSEASGSEGGPGKAIPEIPMARSSFPLAHRSWRGFRRSAVSWHELGRRRIRNVKPLLAALPLLLILVLGAVRVRRKLAGVRGIMPVSSRTVATQIVLLPDMTGYSVDSMTM